MDKTIRRVKSYKVSKDGDVANFALITADGTEVIFSVIPEMIMELILNLMNARTEAFFRAEGGIESEIGVPMTQLRQPIPGDVLKVARHPNPERSLIQIVTPRGGIFEFDLPDSGLPWKKPA